MAKKKPKKDAAAPNRQFQNVTLREENTGKKRVDAHTILKLQHLQTVATWAAKGGPLQLSTHYGRLLAVNAEREGIPLDPSLLSCQRCETILQPGFNCTIRIEKNASGSKHPKRFRAKNNVVYTCHFCSYKNPRQGTRKSHVKELLASYRRRISKSSIVDLRTSKACKSDEGTSVEVDLKTPCREHTSGSPILDVKDMHQKEVETGAPTKASPMTPALEVKDTRPRLPVSVSINYTPVSTCTRTTTTTTTSGKDDGVSNKRKRKGWSSLREVTHGSERKKEQRMNNLAIPFCM